MITQQEFFDQTVRFLHNQGGKSQSEERNCLYTALDGRHCAVGMWINPAVYRPEIEGLNLVSGPPGHEHNTVVWKMLIDSVGAHDWLIPAFVRDLQIAHDLAPSQRRDWLMEVEGSIDRRLADLALKWKLSDAVVRECWP